MNSVDCDNNICFLPYEAHAEIVSCLNKDDKRSLMFVNNYLCQVVLNEARSFVSRDFRKFHIAIDTLIEDVNGVKQIKELITKIELTVSYKEIFSIKTQIFSSLGKLCVFQLANEEKGIKFFNSLANLLSNNDNENFNVIHDFFINIVDAMIPIGDENIKTITKLNYQNQLIQILLKENKKSTVLAMLNKCDQLIPLLTAKQFQIQYNFYYYIIRAHLG